ncbi:hypothetical protein [Methylobacterium nigriterrae]|uniref:hypothetical protein n=1 Tax=Methylobacterium nigriterrae TaxID=3127512 RepID=UPI0030140448
MNGAGKIAAGRPDWVDDPVLLHRLRTALLVLSRGGGTYQQRMTAVMLELTPLSLSSFPVDLQPHFKTLQRTWDEAWARSGSSGTAQQVHTFSNEESNQRTAFHVALLALFEAAVRDTALLEAERAQSTGD